mgnify:CR=1 FL=1
MSGKCLPCPVCGRQPHWYPSMIRAAESIECPWDDGCPENSFDFSTGYLPDDEAVAAWNAAVLAHESEEPAPPPPGAAPKQGETT